MVSRFKDILYLYKSLLFRAAVLLLYLTELKKVDIKLFKEETEKYNKAISIFSSAKCEVELNVMLLEVYEAIDIEKPWKGDFDEYMSNENETLVFK